MWKTLRAVVYAAKNNSTIKIVPLPHSISTWSPVLVVSMSTFFANKTLPFVAAMIKKE